MPVIRLTNPARRPLRGLLRLAPLDLLVAVAIAAFALSVAVAPVLAADPTAVPSAAPVTSPAATVAEGQAGGASPSPSAACPLATPLPTAQPGQSPLPHALCPAVPSATDPLSIVAWLFTPIFQILFMGLVVLYDVTGDIGIAIILLTLTMRILLVPIFRRQIVSQRRMQMIQPEMKAIQTKYKGNRTKISEEQMKLYRERGVNPAAGCLPALLQLLLLLPMYQVFSQGLSAPNISSMLTFGPITVPVTCQPQPTPYIPCINPTVPWLGWLPVIDSTGFHLPGYPGGMDAHIPEIFVVLLPGLFGLSLLALASMLLQVVQTKMMATQTDDPQARSQQRIFLIVPLFSLFYGWILPAGLFIYWITTTIFSIAQQYLIAGWGGLFPLFGWTPGFARNHQPRFPIPSYQPRVETAPATAGASAQGGRRSADESAAGTIRPSRTRARTSRRGRRR